MNERECCCLGWEGQRTLQNTRGELLNERVQGFGEVEMSEWHLQDELHLVLGAGGIREGP